MHGETVAGRWWSGRSGKGGMGLLAIPSLKSGDDRSIVIKALVHGGTLQVKTMILLARTVLAL